jgi:hypothetical protein
VLPPFVHIGVFLLFIIHNLLKRGELAQKGLVEWLKVKALSSSPRHTHTHTHTHTHKKTELCFSLLCMPLRHSTMPVKGKG